MFHHDAAYTGATSGSAPKSSPTVLWSTESQGIHGISPAVVDGVVYASSTDLSAYNATSGEKIWQVTNGGQESSPIVANGVVYTGAYCGTAYDASTGKVIWSRGIKGFVSEAIAVSDGYFYVNRHEGFAQALNATTGAVIWSINTPLGSSYYPAVSNGYLYSGDGAKLRAFNTFNGTEVWQTTLVDDHHLISSNPAVSSGYVYVGCDDQNLYCLNAFNGQIVWNFTTHGSVRSSPAVGYGIVYFGSLDDKVYALNASTGEFIWQYDTGIVAPSDFGVESSAAVADGVVYIGADDGNLYALDAYTGAKLWSYRIQSEFDGFGDRLRLYSSPAIAYGNIYVVTMDHLVITLSKNDVDQNPWLIIIFLGLLISAVTVAVLYALRKLRRQVH